MLRPDLAVACTKTLDQISALIAHYEEHPPGPRHRSPGEAICKPRPATVRHRAHTHYGEPLDDMHEEWRAAHRNRNPQHRSRALDMTRTTNA